MILQPNAKINLGLNVVRKRPDGYHDLETVFYPIPLCDRLEVSLAHEMKFPDLYRLNLNGNPLEGNLDDNLVVKALKLLLEQGYNLKPVDINLTKNIPSGAGLGGGSADAAYMLKALNELFDLQIPVETLERYAASLGADCAVFIQNKSVFAQGIGNIFTSIDLSLNGYYLVVIKPAIFISTKAAFSQIKPQAPKKSLLEIIHQPIETWREWMYNDFEESVFPQFPEIEKLKNKLYETGALYASMSGSGSSLYGIYSEFQQLHDEFPACSYFCMKL